MRSSCEWWCGLWSNAFNRVARLWSNCDVLQCFMCFMFDFCTATYHRAQTSRLYAHIDCPSGGLKVGVGGLQKERLPMDKNVCPAVWDNQYNASVTKCQHLHHIQIFDFQTKVFVRFFCGNNFQLQSYTAKTPTKTVFIANVLMFKIPCSVVEFRASSSKIYVWWIAG